MTKALPNLVSLYENACSLYRDRPAIGTKSAGKWHYITYRQLQDRIDRCRAALAAAGIGPGDRVGIIANNRAEWAVVAYAAYGLRAALVPLYEAQAADDWRFILQDSGTKLVFVSRRDILDCLLRLQKDLPDLRRIVGFDLPDEDPLSFGCLLAASRDSAVAAAHPAFDEIAGIVYTSGTTGSPKGVLQTHENICSNVEAATEIFSLDRDQTLSFLPWAHSFGQTADLHVMLSRGTAIAINDDTSALLPNLAEVRPTILCAVPRIWNRVYERVNERMATRSPRLQALFRRGIEIAKKRSSGQGLSIKERILHMLADRLIFSGIRRKLGGRLRFVVSGSAALNPEVAHFIAAVGITVYEGYGLTEAAPVVTANHLGRIRIGSVGQPLPGVRVEIDRSESPTSREGEVIVYGRNVTPGYHLRPAETARLLRPDGGLRTGDLGYFDEDGYLYITGRVKEQYKLENGKYVAPSPLEEELKLSPYIANVLLHGANRPYNVALVVLNMEALQSWASSQSVCLERIAEHPDVHDLIRREIEQRSLKMRSFERPRRFVLTTEEFAPENGLLTPSLKLRREEVLRRYLGQLEALYPQPGESWMSISS